MTNGAGSAPLNFNGRYSLASYAGGSFAQTNIGELLIFDRRLGDTERLGVETYLVDKWQARSAARTCLTAGFRTARIGHHQTSPRR